MALNWSFWTGLELNIDYCDFACEFSKKFPISPKISIAGLIVIFIVCLGIIW